MSYSSAGAADPVAYRVDATKVRLDGERSANYKLGTVSGAGAITSALESELTASASISGWVYDGSFDPSDTLKAELKAGDKVLDEQPSYAYYASDGNGGYASAPLGAEPTDAGSYKVVATWSGTDNHAAKTAEAPFIVSPRQVTVTAGTPAAKEFDNTALVDSSWSVAPAAEGTGLVGNDTIVSVTVTGSQVYPGSSPNVPSDAKFDPGNSENYKVNYVNGTLTVNSRTTKYRIEATPNGGTAVYDGAEHKAEGLVYSTLTFDDKTYEVKGLSASVVGVDAGEYPVVIKGEATVWDGAQNVTEQFFVDTTAVSKLAISAAPVTIAVNDATKVAGAADPTFTGTVKGLMKDGDLGNITYSRTNASVSDEGTYPGVLTASYTANKNYTVTVNPGTFTITAAPVPIPLPPTPTPTPTPLTPLPTPLPPDDPIAPVVNALEQIIAPIATPLAGPTEETIGDDQTPLSPYDVVNCWVHYYIIIGIIITMLYGAGVLVRRINFTRKLNGYEKDVLREDEENAVEPATTEGKAV